MGDFGSRGSRRAGAHPSAARRAAAPLRCAGARWTRTPREGSRDPGYRLDDPSHRSRSPDPRHPGRGRGGQSQRRPQARRGEWSLDPFTTVQRAPARGAPLEGFRGMGRSQRSNLSPCRLWATSAGISCRGRSRASKDPGDHAPRISTRAPRSSAMAAPSRSRRPPKPPNRRGPTRPPQAILAHAFVSEILQGSTPSSVRSSASRSRRSIGRMATSASRYWARRVSGSRWGQGPFP